jgi:hypothetical protein
MQQHTMAEKNRRTDKPGGGFYYFWTKKNLEAESTEPPYS